MVCEMIKVCNFTNSVFFLCRVVEFASYGDLKNAIEKLSGKEINGEKNQIN